MYALRPFIKPMMTVNHASGQTENAPDLRITAPCCGEATESGPKRRTRLADEAADSNYSSLPYVVLVRKIRYEDFMSQFRAFFAGFRTALAAVIVCALMTGGVFSPAAAHPAGHGIKSAIDCHKLRIVAPAANAETPFDDEGSGACPDCCISASFIDFTLPARAPGPFRAQFARAMVALADLVESDAREDLLAGAGNGARAPPSPRTA